MKLPRSYVIITLLALGACGESVTQIPTVASITLSPTSPAVHVGLSVQFEAKAFNSGGLQLSDPGFTWSSSDPLIASITPDGLATGLAIGTTAITVSAGTATPVSQVMSVQASTCTGRVDVTLAPGEHQAYDGDTCLFLPSGVSGDRYRVAVTRPTLVANPSDVPNVTLAVSPIFNAAQSANPQGVPSATTKPSSSAEFVSGAPLVDGTQFLAETAIRSRTRRFHAELRQREIDLGFTTRPVRPSQPMLASALARVDPPARRDLYLELTCSQTARKPAVLVGFNTDLAIYQDSVQRETQPLSQESTDRMLSYYSDYVRDLVPVYWGETPDTDGNGRVVLTTSISLPDSAAAGVFSGDFQPNIAGGCVGSNEGEVMYFDADIINNMDDVQPNGNSPSYLALSVMAHEMKHITSLYHSVARGDFHDLWIEEGTAELSQTMSSRVAWAAIGGPPVGSQLFGTQIIGWSNSQGGISPEMWGLVSEIADLIVFLSTQPNSFITNPNGASDFHTLYAGSWQWHRFLGDAYGGASAPFADGPLFVEMTDSLTPAGSAGHLQVTGRTFDQLFEELVVAMSLHSGPQPEPARSFTTWDFPSLTSIFSGPAEVAPPHAYPWPVTANTITTVGFDNQNRPIQRAETDAGFVTGLYSCPPRIAGSGDNASYVLPAPEARCAIGPSGIRFHDFRSTGAGAGIQIVVAGAASGRIIVTRLE